MTYTAIARKLATQSPIILDGGTGTDIQRRGAPMSSETWCAEVNATHPEIVEAVHADYIAVGADVITANTFATSALAFNYRKRDDDLLALDAAAMAIARTAAKGTGVCVAASMSTQRPVIPGTDRTDLTYNWEPAHARELFRRKAQNLKALGADLIIMEMMRDADYSLYATEAALETGLPVWIGIAVERGPEGDLMGFGRPDQRYADFMPVLAALKPAAMAIMHTSPNDTAEAIQLLRNHWTGPIGAYPESGHFKSPDWQFESVIPTGGLVDYARQWQTLGASIFGGCCGIGPDHIAALSKEFKK